MWDGVWSATPSLIPLAMLALGAALFRYSPASSHEHDPYLLDLLARVLEAERAGPGGR